MTRDPLAEWAEVDVGTSEMPQVRIDLIDADQRPVIMAPELAVLRQAIR